MRGYVCVLAVCLALALTVSAQEVDEKDVIVLTDANFDESLKKHEKMLVEFYAPWCGHCKQLTPHYAEAATKLKETFPDVAIAKIDADSQKESGTKYGVEGFPTLKWFVNGEATAYTGGRTADTIVSWISKRMGPPTKALTSTKDFDDFKDGNDVVVVGFFDKPESDDFKVFEAVASEIEDVELGSAHDKAVHKHASHKNGEIVLFKKFDAGKSVYKGKMNAKDIKEFVAINQLKFVNEFAPETSSKIFGSPVNKQVLLFADKADKNFDTVYKKFEAQAKEHYGKVVGVHVNSDTKQVMEFFGVSESEVPCVFAVKVPPKDDSGQGGMKKFKGPDSTKVTDDKALKTFFNDFVKDKVEAHKKSEPVPEKVVDEHGVTTLVGTNFEEIVLKSDKDVLVEFYAPWCGHCKQLAPLWDKLGEQFTEVETMVIAKMDATANDPPESIEIQGFPTLKFFKSGSKDKPMNYDGDRTVKGFRKFLKANAGKPFELAKKDKKKKASAEL